MTEQTPVSTSDKVKLSVYADRILRQAYVSGFLTASQARHHNKAVQELLEHAFLKLQMINSMDCYVVSQLGVTYVESNDPFFE